MNAETLDAIADAMREIDNCGLKLQGEAAVYENGAVIGDTALGRFSFNGDSETTFKAAA